MLIAQIIEFEWGGLGPQAIGVTGGLRVPPQLKCCL